MTKIRLAILLALCIIIAGCGEDNELQVQEELRIISVIPNGGDIAPNVPITLTFNKKVSSVTVMIDGNRVTRHTSVMVRHSYSLSDLLGFSC